MTEAATRRLSRPTKALLALRIGYFLWRAPRRLRQTALPTLLETLRESRGGRSAGARASHRDVARFRGRWLRLPGFRNRNTCYMRALTLFRFLDPQGGQVRIHFGVEESHASDRPRGHAWVSLDGQVLEVPGPVAAGRVREVYVFPASERCPCQGCAAAGAQPAPASGMPAAWRMPQSPSPVTLHPASEVA